tara:strand:+ start:498 stop:1013 length:516 start_codon:yes stop_codon:yes gene_type:complete
MNSVDRIQLEKMIRENEVNDCSQDIKNKKHSNLIKDDVNKILLLKSKYNRLQLSNPKQFEQIIISQCKFLHTNYKDIFNKLMKDEINLSTLFKMLEHLKTIENGDKDQHEASYEVGKLLKQIYIDSVLLREQNEKIKENKKNKNKKKKIKEAVKIKNISWNEFKSKNNITI